MASWSQQNEADSLCDVQAFPMATGPAQQVLPAGPGWGEGPKGRFLPVIAEMHLSIR